MFLFFYITPMVDSPRNIFDFNHIDTTLSKGTRNMLRNLYTHYYKKDYGYEKLYRSYQRKKSDLPRCCGQSRDNCGGCRKYNFEPHCARFSEGVWRNRQNCDKRNEIRQKIERANLARAEYKKILDPVLPQKGPLRQAEND